MCHLLLLLFLRPLHQLRLLTLEPCGEIRLRRQITVGLRWLMLNNLVLQLHMTLKSSLRTVEPLTIGIRTWQSFKNIAVTTPMQFLTVFKLTAFDFRHLFE
jgi:hypothetical protein